MPVAKLHDRRSLETPFPSKPLQCAQCGASLHFCTHWLLELKAPTFIPFLASGLGVSWSLDIFWVAPLPTPVFPAVLLCRGQQHVRLAGRLQPTGSTLAGQLEEASGIPDRASGRPLRHNICSQCLPSWSCQLWSVVRGKLPLGIPTSQAFVKLLCSWILFEALCVKLNKSFL